MCVTRVCVPTHKSAQFVGPFVRTWATLPPTHRPVAKRQPHDHFQMSLLYGEQNGRPTRRLMLILLCLENGVRSKELKVNSNNVLTANPWFLLAKHTDIERQTFSYSGSPCVRDPQHTRRSLTTHVTAAIYYHCYLSIVGCGMSTSVLMMPANSRHRVIMIREKSVVDSGFLSRLFALFQLLSGHMVCRLTPTHFAINSR